MITDERAATALRLFVRACDPLLTKLPDDENFEHALGDHAVDTGRLKRAKRRLRRVRRPGSANWSTLPVDERVHWWISRVGRLTALAASVTGLAGALGDRLPVQDTLGVAGQGLLLCAIAAEHGVADHATRVRLLGAVLLRRDIPPELAAGPVEDPPANQVPERGRLGVTVAAKWLWRQGRQLLAITDELANRPHGRFYHRLLGMLPVVGLIGDYLGERAALKRAARAADRWLTAPRSSL